MPRAKGREPPGCNYITERKMQTENQRTKTQKEEKNVGMLDSLVKTCVRPLGENWTFCERSSTNLTPRKKATLCKIRQQQKAIVCKQNLVLRSAPVTPITCFTRCLASPRPLLLNDSACRGHPQFRQPPQTFVAPFPTRLKCVAAIECRTSAYLQKSIRLMR